MLLALNMKGFDIVVTTVNNTIENNDDTTLDTIAEIPTSSITTKTDKILSSTTTPDDTNSVREGLNKALTTLKNYKTTSNVVVVPLTTKDASKHRQTTFSTPARTHRTTASNLERSSVSTPYVTQIQTEITGAMPSTVPSSLVSDPVKEYNSTNLSLVLPLVVVSLVLCLVVGLYWACRDTTKRQGLRGTRGSKEVRLGKYQCETYRFSREICSNFL